MYKYKDFLLLNESVSSWNVNDWRKRLGKIITICKKVHEEANKNGFDLGTEWKDIRFLVEITMAESAMGTQLGSSSSPDSGWWQINNIAIKDATPAHRGKQNPFDLYRFLGPNNNDINDKINK